MGGVISPGGMMIQFIFLIFSSSAFALLPGGTFPSLGSKPVISNFFPTQGAAGTLVTITGSGFLRVTDVTIGGVNTTDILVDSDTVITVRVPPETFTSEITIENPAGFATTAGSDMGHLGNGKFESLCDPVIDESRSLAINHNSVINDSIRTAAGGHWNFNFLMGQMAPPNMSTSLFIKKWLKNWFATTVMNGHAYLSPGANGVAQLLNNWPRVSGSVEGDGTMPLDLSVQKFKLIAILLRPDLAGNCVNCEGEGRFVWQVLGGSFPDEVIMEFKLPIANVSSVTGTTKNQWRQLIHDLSTFALGSPKYKSKLQEVTDRFAMKNFSGVAGMVNGSGINQVRTNAIGLEGGSNWQMREFKLTPSVIGISNGVVGASAGELVSSTTNATPADELNFPSSETEIWVNSARAGILAGTAVLPINQLGGRAPIGNGWSFASVPNNVRKAFDMSTCNGCHSPSVNINSNNGSGSMFLHAGPRGFSNFMTGNGTGVISLAGRNVTARSAYVKAPFNLVGSEPIPNSTYSDLHVRAHDLINKILQARSSGGLCQ